MRYKLGLEYPFLFVSHDGWGRVFNPAINQLKYMRMIRLTCREHYPTPVSHHEGCGLTADGFVFVGDGQRWFNQYPVANYGSVDDPNDLVVRLKVSSAPRVDSREFDAWFFGYYDARDYLRRVEEITRGYRKGYDPVKMAPHRDAVMKEMKQLMGMDVSFRAMTYEIEDGIWKSLPDALELVLV